ncbi:hypothetical protein Zm00014a_036223, partial [Zea mays]
PRPPPPHPPRPSIHQVAASSDLVRILARYHVPNSAVSRITKMASPRGGFDEQDRRTEKGTEVFVGGLPWSATESMLRQNAAIQLVCSLLSEAVNINKYFSSCGEIIDAYVMKGQSGHSKGYGFVRFAKRDYANTAKRQKNGIELQGKRLVFELSMDQDTVFFGNLCKEWTLEEFEELIHKAFKDVVSVDLAMASNLDSSNKKNINRGFGFVRFSSHAVSLSLTGGQKFSFSVHSAFFINLNIVL